MNDEAQLMRKIARGDKQAFELIYKQYSKPLASYLYRLSLDKSLVEELLQDVFLRIWERAGSFKGRSSLKTFIFTIAHNIWVNYVAKFCRHGAMLPSHYRFKMDATTIEIDTDQVDQELLGRLKQGLMELPHEERETLILAQMGELSYEEIGKVLKAPTGTIKSRVFNAIKKLRSRLI